jgi:glycosyltransferase involved in cell wall biosynthesis
VGGIPDLVTERGTGLLSEPDDIVGLTLALQEVLTKPDLRRAMGEAARDRALQMFSQESIASRHAHIYEFLAREQLKRSVGVDRRRPVGFGSPPMVTTEKQRSS